LKTLGVHFPQEIILLQLSSRAPGTPDSRPTESFNLHQSLRFAAQSKDFYTY
jgi:hypothetical protein